MLELNDTGSRRDPHSANGQEDRVQAQWKVLANSRDEEAFIAAWLSLQCTRISEIHSAVIIICSDSAASPFLCARWPSDKGTLEDLKMLAKQAFSERRTLVQTSDPSIDLSRTDLVDSPVSAALPLGAGSYVVAAVAFRLVRSKGFNPTQIESIIESMRWGAGWLEALPLSRSLESASSDVAKAFTCLDVLAGIEDSADLKSTAIAIANTLATQLKCDRVSVGVRRRSGRSRVIALSHSADFRRKAQLIEAIENAMEEAMDQRSTVVYPEIPQAQRTVSIAHRTLCEASRAENPAAMSLLLSDCKGELVGAVTLERSNGIKFDADAMQLSEAITALIGPVFGLQAQLNRPISGRLAASAAHAVSAIFGPGRPTLKIGAVCAAGLLGLAATLQSDYRISAKSIVEPDIRRAAAAPFDGFIRTAKVRAGDAVKSGDLLASLDEQGLQLERSKWQAERNKLIQKQRDAIAKHNRSELVVLDLQIKETQSQTDLAEDNLRRSKILAPFDGTIVSGDLSQMLGAPVEKGKVLFEIAPLATHRVILHVDERDIRYVATGQSGSMALAGMPSTPLPLVLGKITPVTFKEDGRNVFYVEAQLVETNPLLRPGMEGVAKINVGERPVLWIWTRTLFEWLRLSIWQLLP